MSHQTAKNLALAEQHFRAGRHSVAESLLRRMLVHDPGSAKAHELLAYLAGNHGRLGECESLLSQAFALPGCSAEACFYLGRVRLQMGRPAQALGPLLRSLERGGEFFEALHEVGVVHSALGDDENALAFFRRAQRLQPRSHELHTNMAGSLAALRRHHEAIAHSRLAISIAPHGAKAWTDLGLTLTDLCRYGEALKSFDRALVLAPRDVVAVRGRAVTLARAGRHGEALAAYRALECLAPDTDYLRGSLLQETMRVCDWSDWLQRVRHTLAGVDAGERASAPFALMAVPASAAQLLACARTLTGDVCPAPPLVPTPAAPRIPAGGGRLRIAYFSADFGDHPTSQLIAGLFEHHARQRFEIFGYSLAPRPDCALRRRVMAGVDHFVEVADRSDAEVAAMAHAAGIDIAVDLMGFTEGCRPRIFSLRAAPLQVGYLGFPGSMGSDAMDYIVADATLIGAQDRVHYAEKVLTLPDSYQVNDDRKAIAELKVGREDVGLPQAGFVFACFNALQKITPDVFDSWMRILRRVPGSVLWLLRGSPEAVAALEEEASARGMDPARLVWADRLPLADHLARHALADLFLDTFHYNAHTTCSDALWAGLPVLTLQGQTFSSRVAASLLKAVGLPELVSHTAQAHEAQAVALGLSAQGCLALRRRLLRQRPLAPLFQTALFTRRLEAGYEAMAARQRQGLPPEHISLDAS